MIMKKKLLPIIGTMMVAGLVLAGCSTNATTESSTSQTSAEVKKETMETPSETKGENLTHLLSGTNWQGTKVYDKDNNDLTAENQGFIGLAKYDQETGYYEFFDKETGETRGDEGTFFLTADGEKRVLISKTNNYQAVVDVTELTEDIFTYKRMGKDKAGQDVEVFVDHIPYSDKDLAFTNGREALTSETGTIETAQPGSAILGGMLWNGTKVIDEEGNDVTEANQAFISLAKFDEATSTYEFFNLETGETRGDFGYFDVLAHNKVRAHVSIGENKYGAVLEITELNDKKFTYKRMGKDNNDQEITVFVEHEPYTGEFDPTFTF